jgi:hypothetical protein
MNLIVDVRNVGLSIVLKNSAIKNRNSINDIKKSYKIPVSVLKCYNSPLKTLIVVVRSIRKL